MSVEEDLTADQIENVRIHYASRIEDVLAVALPKSVSEEKKDEAIRENIIEHAGSDDCLPHHRRPANQRAFSFCLRLAFRRR